MWTVYFLQSTKQKWYYVGSTNRLSQRLNEHNSGKVKSTKGYRPLELVYVEEYCSESEARGREQQIKSRRIAKEEILRQIIKVK